MNKLSIVLLSLVFSSISFASTKCETLLNSARSNMQAIEDALASNDKIKHITEKLGEEQFSCEDINAAVNIYNTITEAGSVAARDMGAAEQLKCETNPQVDTKGEDIFLATMYFEMMSKQLQDAQTAQNCK
ncbi:MAG: hypothetical protein ACM3MG_12255 [Bacillota bacterium]